ncbi:hypothetical protein HU200_040169 [Digitaria exilis]|uniref:C2H2-type domain-containing protein n=1 Tax=Digitaria exilis TaxID=1010633 RepID=A0A835EEW8_9POAL|nr:hypothetical protein HU200_040169 [Digitaria exilis]CAB3451533.1 unnamed protein product [Digitaria exilis]
MDLSQETSKDDGASARTLSPSGGDQAGDDDKEMQKQRAGSGDDEDDDDEGTRQPYKCTFCRRGFPTAQALGGHMNVHRRHRGRSSATAPIAAAAAHHQGSSSSCYEQHPSTAVVAFGLTHPATSLSERKRPYELRLFGRDDCAAAAGGRRGNKEGDVRRDRCYARDDGDGGADHVGGEAELDLELRLGP